MWDLNMKAPFDVVYQRVAMLLSKWEIHCVGMHLLTRVFLSVWVFISALACTMVIMCGVSA
jgi:hypothetical protein